MTQDSSILTSPSVPRGPTVRLPFDYRLLSLDFLFRLLVWLLWHTDVIPTWAFWFFQFLFIPFFVFIAMGVQLAKVSRYFDKNSSLVPEGGRLSVVFAWAVVLVGVFFMFRSLGGPTWLRYSGAAIAFVLYGANVNVLYDSSVRLPRARKQVVLLTEEPLDLGDEADENDVRIVRMETEVFTISQRVESFTIESALFGALAFSAFVTLITADTHILPAVDELVATIRATTFRNLLSATFWHGIGTPESLRAMIAVETLFCSLLFVSVIVARIKFYEVLRQVEFSVRISRVWNDKEDGVYASILDEQSTRLDARLARLSRLVGDAIEAAEPLLKDLRAISNYMWRFRNLGIAAFVLILVTSAFLLSSSIAFLFIVIWLSTLIYDVVGKFSRRRRFARVRLFQVLEGKLLRMFTPKRN